MDNKNEKSQSWTDPITGEVYPSGNPHISIRQSVPADPSVKVRSFRDQDPEPEVREIYPEAKSAQPGQPIRPGQVLPNGMTVQQVQNVRRVQTPVQQIQYGNIPQIVERPVSGVPVPANVTKFCEHCGSVISKEAVICPSCGCQVAALQQIQAQPAVIINNNNIIQGSGVPKDKMVALLLCIFFGVFGVHRFYEGKYGTGFLYLFTGGLFGIGWIADLIRIACQPKQYYV